MQTLNDILSQNQVVSWAGSKLARSSVANTNASSVATSIPVPIGASYVTISSRGAQDFQVWITQQGASAPTKASTAGAQSVNGSGQGRWEGFLDPGDLPLIWVAEFGVSDDTFDIVFR